MTSKTNNEINKQKKKVHFSALPISMWNISSFGAEIKKLIASQIGDHFVAVPCRAIRCFVRPKAESTSLYTPTELPTFCSALTCLSVNHVNV